MSTYLSPNPRLPWPICREAVELIARAEGLRLDAYQDVAGIWTIGRGHTGQDVHAGLRWSLDHADEVFLQDVTATTRAVCKLLDGCTQSTPPSRLKACAPPLGGQRVTDPQSGAGANVGGTSPQEIGAMVSLAYNIGTAAFARSTVLRAHRAGDTAAAARAFQLWNKATINGRKVEVAGLVRRRAQEAALYLSAAPSVSHADVVGANNYSPLPVAETAPTNVSARAVTPESSPQQSPLHQSGALSLISGGLGMAAAASGDVRTLAENLHINLGAVCAAVSLVVGAVVIYWRWRQRREGWA